MRGFIYTNQAYYARFSPGGDLAVERGVFPVTHEVMIGGYPEGGGGTTGEFAVRWYRFPTGELVANLEAFEDGWTVLASYTDLLAEIGRLGNTLPQPDAFILVLRRLGFADRTLRKPEMN